jgi:hypothetical protein
MKPLRIDHLELTVPRGALTPEYRAELDAFYCTVFGWTSNEHHYANQIGHMYRPDARSFILLMEDDQPMQAPSYTVTDALGDTQFFAHAGLLCETNEELDELLERCVQFQRKDPRVEIKEFPPFVDERRFSRNFVVRYLLPFWFDVHVILPKPGYEPEHDWQYA